MREDVSFEHLFVDLQFDAFDDDLSDAAEESGVRLASRQTFEFWMASDEEAVVRVRRRDARNADARLGKDVVDGQGDDVLRFDRWNLG